MQSYQFATQESGRIPSGVSTPLFCMKTTLYSQVDLWGNTSCAKWEEALPWVIAMLLPNVEKFTYQEPPPRLPTLSPGAPHSQHF